MNPSKDNYAREGRFPRPHHHGNHGGGPSLTNNEHDHNRENEGPGNHRHGAGRGRGGRGGAPGGGFRPHGRSRARRGDVRWALLSLLEEGPSNGYGLMTRMEEKTDGLWRSSPGSVYPQLTQMVEEGLLITQETAPGKSEYQLSDEGRAFVEENRERIEQVWEPTQDRSDEIGALIEASHSVMAAAKQIGRFGTKEQREKATEKLTALRRDLYQILAD